MISSSRSTRRKRAVESFGSAADCIGTIEKDMSLFAITRGQFSMLDAAENRELYLDIAALLATLVAHDQMEHRTQVYRQPGQKQTWKWAARRTRPNR